MLIQHNYLKKLRRKHHLRQSDLVVLTESSNCSAVSRWEAGLRLPSIEIMLLYHLTFDVPIEHFFERQRKELKPALIEQMKSRLKQLEASGASPSMRRRIAFLSERITRLSS